MKIIPFGSNVIAKVLPDSDMGSITRFEVVTLPAFAMTVSSQLRVGSVIHAKHWLPANRATSVLVVIEWQDILCIIEDE